MSISPVFVISIGFTKNTMKVTQEQLILLCYVLSKKPNKILGTNGYWETTNSGGRFWIAPNGLLKELHCCIKKSLKTVDLSDDLKKVIQIHCNEFLSCLSSANKNKMNNVLIKNTIKELKNIIEICKKYMY